MNGPVMVLPRLYAILDATVAERHGWALPDLAQACLAGGGRLLQVRAKGPGSGTLLRLCEEVVARAQPYGATVIVNDRADVARLAGAAGVHVGQDDLPVWAVRRVVGDEALVGLSTHSVEQIEAAAAERITYLAVGPVFATGTKDTGYTSVGLDLVRDAVRRSRGRPVVAIGGITLERARSVLEAGAAAVAVIADLLTGADPEARVRAFLAALEGPSLPSGTSAVR